MKIFIGWDSREPEAYHVASHSIITRASRPVSITPLVQSQLRKLGAYTREQGPTESTEFSLTRFLVPWLCNYEGYALFVDCDVLVQADIHEIMLYVMADPGKAVYVAQHDYVPKSEMKMDGKAQTSYPCKNWSSVMLFDCSKCKALSPDYINNWATGLDLHRFNWLKTGEIGQLDIDWNWLVGEYGYCPEEEFPWTAPVGDTMLSKKVPPKLLHYTLGGPWFENCKDCNNADLWLTERDKMLAAKS